MRCIQNQETYKGDLQPPFLTPQNPNVFIPIVPYYRPPMWFLVYAQVYTIWVKYAGVMRLNL